MAKSFKLTKSQTEASIAHYIMSSEEFRKLFERITERETEHYFNTIAKQLKVSPEEVKFIYALKNELRGQGRSEEDIVNYLKDNKEVIRDHIKELNIQADKKKRQL